MVESCIAKNAIRKAIENLLARNKKLQLKVVVLGQEVEGLLGEEVLGQEVAEVQRQEVEGLLLMIKLQMINPLHNLLHNLIKIMFLDQHLIMKP